MKRRKLIAPVLVTCLICLVFLGYLLLFAKLWSISKLPLILGGIVVFGLGSVAIYNLWERIQEIRSGDEDDLDNY